VRDQPFSILDNPDHHRGGRFGHCTPPAIATTNRRVDLPDAAYPADVP
jgi:hypothetical protein